MIKYFIVGFPRTGSTLLYTLLKQQHKGIFEPFNPFMLKRFEKAELI